MKTSSVHSMADREPNCLTIETHSGVYSVAFSPDGKTVAALPGRTGSVSLWCSKTGHKVAGMNFTPMTHSPAFSVAFSQWHGMKVKAILAAGCADGAIYLWESSTGESYKEPIDRLTGDRDLVSSLACTADGSMLVSGSYDCSARLWDVSKKQQLMRFNGHTGYVLSVATTGNKIASGDNDSTVRIWDMSTGTELLQITQ